MSDTMARMLGRNTATWSLVLLFSFVGLYLSQRMLVSFDDALSPPTSVKAVSPEPGFTELQVLNPFSPTDERAPEEDLVPPRVDGKALKRREADEESLVLLELAKDPTKTIHITHFFSTFSVPSSSPAYLEQMIVQESWKRAAIYALENGIHVEFIDNTLPDDDACSPPYATRIDMTWWLKDVKKGKVPTVGENFYIAKERGRGELMMFTNADIGVLPDFYLRAREWATKDFLTPPAQLEAMTYTSKYARVCFFQLSAFKNAIPPLHLETCVEDARVFYIHAGGFDELWDDVKLEIALNAVKLQMREKSEEATTRRFQEMVQLFSPSQNRRSPRINDLLEDLSSSDWRQFVQEFELKGPTEEQLLRIPKPLFAGTVTRMDLDVVINASASAWMASPDQLYKKMVGSVQKLGVRHPGNDCFLFHRDNLPDAVRLMGHPAGVRPFGHWLALSWWDSQYPYRRITATKRSPWTFHVGIGLWGMDSIPWRERANQDPSYTLFLAANFDRLSQGAFRRMFSGPSVCQNSTVPWRAPRFCNSVSNEYCAGIIRYGCYYNLHFSLRDVGWYYETCQHLHIAEQGKIQSPICELCNFLFKSKPPGSKKRFTCEVGKAKYCKGLPNEICPDEE